MSEFLPFSRPAMGVEELAAVKEVLESGWITTGPKNQALEQAFCQLTGNQHAIAVSSATAGMHITLMALKIGKGDEVITPSLTWVSTLNMISLLGATPVMVDVDRDTLMVTPEAIESAITPRTKAIIPVHYAGAPADIDAIRAIGERYGIAVIEDAAHAVGTYYKGRHIGAKGTAIFSFHAIKNITCAEGGLIVTDIYCWEFWHSLSEKRRDLMYSAPQRTAIPQNFPFTGQNSRPLRSQSGSRRARLFFIPLLPDLIQYKRVFYLLVLS